MTEAPPHAWLAWQGIALLAAGAGTSALVLAGLLRMPIARRVLDHPNHRSLHAVPTPRIGGLGVLAGLAVSLAALRPDLPAGLWAALALLVAVSLTDDLRGVPAAVRLPLHLTAAALACTSVAPQLSPAWLALTAIATGWAINLYNFMDGLDGLAGGQAVFGFGAYGLAALQADAPALALTSAAVAGAALGFLRFNFPPARVFLGDAGSTALGLLAAAIGLAGVVRGHWPWWFPPVAFLPFVLDASVTLALRLLGRQRVWEAHREHAYQRLSLSGLGHLRTALAYYALMAVSAGVAVGALGAADGAVRSGLLVLTLLALYAAVCGGTSGRARADRRP